METGIGSPSNPSPNHLAALAKEEAERKRVEAARALLNPSAGIDVLAAVAADPKKYAKHLAEMQAAQHRHDAAKAAAEQRIQAAEHAERNLAAKQRAVDAEIEKKQAAANNEVKAMLAEATADRAAAQRLKNEAAADRAAAAKDKAEQERRLRAMEGAAI